MPDGKRFSASILITGEIAQKLTDGFTKTAKRTDALGSSIKRLQGTTAMADRMSSLYGNRLARMAQLQANAQKTIALQAQNAAAPTKKLQGEISRLAQSSERLQRAVLGDTASLTKMNADLVKAGVNTSKLRLEQIRLHGQLDQLRVKAKVFGEIKEGAQQAGEAMKIMWEAGKRGLEVLGGFSLGTFGLMRFTSDTAKKVADLKSLAEGLGMTATELQQVQYAAGRFGVEADGTNGVLERLNRATAAAKDGLSLQGKAFQRLGLDANALSLRSPIEKLRDLSDALGHMSNEQDRSQLTSIIFGKGADAARIGTMMSKGRAAFDQSLVEAKEKGAALSDEQNKQFEEYDSRWKSFYQRLANLRQTLGMRLQEPMLRLANTLATFFDQHQGEIVTFVERLGLFAKEAAPTVLSLANAALALGSGFLHLAGTFPRLTILSYMFAKPALDLGILVGKTKWFRESLAELAMTGSLAEVALLPLLGWAAGLAAAGYVVSKFWTPISTFFKGFGKEFFRDINPLVRSLAPLKPVLSAIAESLHLINQELETLTGRNLSSLGGKVGNYFLRTLPGIGPLAAVAGSPDEPKEQSKPSILGLAARMLWAQSFHRSDTPPSATQSPPAGQHVSFNTTVHVHGGGASGDDIGRQIAREQKRQFDQAVRIQASSAAAYA